MTPAEIIDPYLKRDEVILWQGRPQRVFAPGVEATFPVLFGLLFAGIAGYSVVRAFQGGVFFMLAFLFMAVGLALVFHVLFSGMVTRKFGHYILTNYRAFVLEDMPLLGVSFSDWPITPKTDLRHNARDPMTITFGLAPRRFSRGKLHPVGFEFIEEGLYVFRVMMDIRDGLH